MKTLNKISAICLLVTAVFTTSCFHQPYNGEYEEALPGPVAYRTTESSVLFNKEYFDLSIDSLDKVLRISLRFKEGIKKFPFPKSSSGQELNLTSFKFEFYSKGKLIEGAALPVYARNERVFYLYGYNKWMGETITFNTDTIDLRYSPAIEFTIPYYAFNKLKAGMNNLELKVFQNTFCSSTTMRKARLDSGRKDSTIVFERAKRTLALLKTKIDFKLIIPTIYKNGLINEIIELRNDSTYNPAGSDNTIWNSSYPDLYWTIDYPLDQNYATSDYQKSTAQYTGHDTFYVYHYSMKDSIEIGVWDHDNLSRDDFIAGRKFCFNQLKIGKTSRFAFGHVRRFDVKLMPGGIINR